jgi:hypothetical protein
VFNVIGRCVKDYLMKNAFASPSPFLPLAFFALSACGSPEIGAATSELKTVAKGAVGDVMSEAGLSAGGLLTTENACLLAGQSQALCGCLSTELGSEIDQTHIDGLTQGLKSSLGGDIKGALKGASSIDPETRTALTKCGARAAIAGAIGP